MWLGQSSQPCDGIYKLSTSPDGKLVAAIHYSSILSIWHVPSLRLKQSWQLGLQVILSNCVSCINALSVFHYTLTLSFQVYNLTPPQIRLTADFSSPTKLISQIRELFNSVILLNILVLVYVIWPFRLMSCLRLSWYLLALEQLNSCISYSSYHIISYKPIGSEFV